MEKNFAGLFIVFKINAFELDVVFCGCMVRLRTIRKQWFNIQDKMI